MLKRSNLLALALGSVVALTAVADTDAKTPQFDEIWAFGDSLSDAGNFFALSGEVEPPVILPETVPPVVGYNDGRYTDGFLWVERLAPLVGAETIYSLAVGGAYAGVNNQFAPVPLGLLSQVQASGADSSDLVTIWVGANDYFAWTLSPLDSIANSCIDAGLLPPDDAAECAALVVGDIVDAIEILHEGGARTFLIANLPDLGANPFGSFLELGVPGIQGVLEGITVVHNQLLAESIESMRSDPLFADSSFVLLDMFTGFNELLTRSGRYNLSETDSGCLFRDLEDVTPPFRRFVVPDLVTPFEPPFLCPLQEDGTLDSSGFLFWDQIHPSRAGHDLVGIYAYETLIKGLRWPETMRNREEKIIKRALSRLRSYARSGKPEYEILEAWPALIP